MGKDVYVDLFSNSSLDTFPDNTVSSFKVKLSRPLELVGEYECAVAQVICPSATAVLTHGEIIIGTYPETKQQKLNGQVMSTTFPFNNATIIGSSYYPKPTDQKEHQYTPMKLSNKLYAYKHSIPNNKYFLNGNEVVSYINELFSNPSTDIFGQVVKQRIVEEGEDKYPAKFYADPYEGNLTVAIRDTDFSVAISGTIARILGFGVTDDQYVIFGKSGTYKFHNQKVNINAGPSIMSIYTNVILPHRVGDTSASLIRVCTVPTIKEGASSNHFINFEFDTLHYLPVALKYIQDVEVEIRGPQGNLFPFNFGIFYLRLHFKHVVT